MKRHIISALVENKFGVLARIAGLFSARGYNIDSLAVGITEDPSISRMTIVVNAEDEKILEQIQKQLHKLIDVITVVDLTKKEHVERELVLIRVAYDTQTKKKVDSLVRKFKLHIVSRSKDSCIIEVCLVQAAMQQFLDAAQGVGIQQLVRTGRIAMQK